MTIRKKTRNTSLAKRSWQKFIQNRMAILGLIGLVLIIAACLAAPLLTNYDPTLIDPSIRGLSPSREHLLGTDRLGRDIFARILYGGRWSIMTLINMLCIGFMGKSVRNLLLIFTFTGWPGVMRIVRGRILSLKQEPYVESCRANGIGGMSIMFHHLLPNTLGPIRRPAMISPATCGALTFLARRPKAFANIIIMARRTGQCAHLGQHHQRGEAPGYRADPAHAVAGACRRHLSVCAQHQLLWRWTARRAGSIQQVGVCLCKRMITSCAFRI